MTHHVVVPIAGGERVTCVFGEYADRQLILLHNPAEDEGAYVLVRATEAAPPYAFLDRYDDAPSGPETPDYEWDELLEHWWPLFALTLIGPHRVREYVQGDASTTLADLIQQQLHA